MFTYLICAIAILNFGKVHKCVRMNKPNVGHLKKKQGAK